MLGFYVTGHPLSRYAEILRRYELASTAQISQLQDGQSTRIGVNESLTHQQRDLLHDLGYNDYVRSPNHRKLS